MYADRERRVRTRRRSRLSCSNWRAASWLIFVRSGMGCLGLLARTVRSARAGSAGLAVSVSDPILLGRQRAPSVDRASACRAKTHVRPSSRIVSMILQVEKPRPSGTSASRKPSSYSSSAISLMCEFMAKGATFSQFVGVVQQRHIVAPVDATAQVLARIALQQRNHLVDDPVLMVLDAQRESQAVHHADGAP